MKRSFGVRCAFTLVELLVVIAIIGILVALLLPAVQAAREGGRRTQCANQLKQLALALANFEDTNGHLPAAGAPVYKKTARNMYSWHDAVGGRGGWSWFIEILPYIEQEALHDQWDFSKNLYANKAIATTDIAGFYCPTRRSQRIGDEGTAFEGWTTGGNDYGACIGWGNAFHDDFDQSYTKPCIHSYSNERQIERWNEGQAYEVAAPADTAGMFSPFGELKLKGSLTD